MRIRILHSDLRRDGLVMQMGRRELMNETGRELRCVVTPSYLLSVTRVCLLVEKIMKI